MNLVFKALADPTRRHVLELLRVRPMTAGELANISVSKATMSAHFAVLREADLVGVHKANSPVICQLRSCRCWGTLLGFVGARRPGHQATRRHSERDNAMRIHRNLAVAFHAAGTYLGLAPFALKAPSTQTSSPTTSVCAPTRCSPGWCRRVRRPAEDAGDLPQPDGRHAHAVCAAGQRLGLHAGRCGLCDRIAAAAADRREPGAAQGIATAYVLGYAAWAFMECDRNWKSRPTA